MKLLLVRFSSLGDVILVSSLLSPLEERGVVVDLLTFKPFGEVFKGDGRLRNLIQLDRKSLRSLSSLKQLSKEIDSRKYDYVVDLHRNLRTFFLRAFSRTCWIGFKKRSFLRRLMVVFKPFKAQQLYVPSLYTEALKRIGIEINNPVPFIPVDGKEINNVRKLLPESPFIVIAPGARWESKRYPIERFRRVAELMRDFGYSVVAVGGREDRDWGERITAGIGLNLCGRLSLRESMAVMRLSAGVISNDSAAVHMARAVKTPVVVIFGPTHPSFGFAPSSEEGKAVTLNLPCSPCSLHGRTSCKERRCFDISPERIAEEMLSLIK